MLLVLLPRLLLLTIPGGGQGGAACLSLLAAHLQHLVSPHPTSVVPHL